MLSIRPKNLSVTVKALILVGLSVLLISCETVSYYTQAARGQMAIVFGRQDIQHLLESDDLELTALTTRHVNLEDVFVSLTGRHLGDE